jgi:hypothetical protein
LRFEGALFFDPGPDFPTWWVLGLVGFLAVWWYVIGRSPQRRMFLVFWVPGALVSALCYRLGEQGQSVAGTLRLLARRDPATWRELLNPPHDGFVGTYGFVVGGTVAAFASMAWQLAGIILGTILAMFLPGARGRRA